MIDDMVTTLKAEAENDLKVRDECNENFRTAEQTEKDLDREIKASTADIEESTEKIAAQTAVLKKNADDIAAAEAAMAEATEQRKADNAEFLAAVDLNNQAVALIGKAKDKLNSFYNPQLVEKSFLEQAPEVY